MWATTELVEKKLSNKTRQQESNLYYLHPF